MERAGWSRGAWIVAVVGVAAVAAGSAFAATQYASRTAIQGQSPAHGSAVASTRPLVEFAASNGDRLSDIRVTLDGVDRTTAIGRNADGRIVLPTRGLKDGVHRVAVTVRTRNLFSRTVSSRWSFTVDTTRPELAVISPKSQAEVNRKRLPVTGTAEPGATVRVRWKSGTATATATPAGRWTVGARVPEGAVAMRIQATDAAGNTTTMDRSVTVDTRAPTLTLAKVAPTVTETDAPTFYGRVAGETPARTTISATVNGRTVTPAAGGAGGVPKGASVTFTGAQFAVSLGTLPQGTNRIEIAAADPAGNRSVRRVTLLVDSSEELGSYDMVEGARGADVRALQQQLKDRGFRRTKVTGVYDPQTVRSVKNYQRVRKIRQSGVFGPRTREAFVGKIVVTLSKFRLQLIRDGKVVATYPVAVGQPAFPTPTGEYSVVNMQRDPTWTPPPDSSWAKGLGPIPPGPGNPLGTRWIGTSAPYVGIHGTSAPSSIGTRASHGCIRMKIPDVEALYEQVSVGMPVILRA